MHICQPANLPGTSVLEIGWKRQASLAIRPSWRDCIGGTEWELIGPSCLLSYFFSLTRIPGGNGQAVSRSVFLSRQGAGETRNDRRQAHFSRLDEVSWSG